MSFWRGGLSAAEAKKQYFLTPADLACLPHESFGGFGCGNSKIYSEHSLEGAALRKHGVAGLAAKREKREKREENKRKREAEAEQAAEELLTSSSSSKKKARSDDDVIDLTGDAATSPVAAAATAAAPAVDAAKLKSLRKEMRRALKSVMTWDYMRSKRAPNGAVGTVRLERIEQVEYCALIGRSADPELRTLVKNGAWYSLEVPFETAFGAGAAALRGSGGAYGSNSDLGVDPAHGLTLKYQPKSKTLGVHVYVSHVESHEGALDHLNLW
jgi:hypothetical protein